MTHADRTALAQKCYIVCPECVGTSGNARSYDYVRGASAVMATRQYTSAIARRSMQYQRRNTHEIQRTRDGIMIRRILTDAIGAACVIALPFVFLYIAYGFGGAQ